MTDTQIRSVRESREDETPADQAYLEDSLLQTGLGALAGTVFGGIAGTLMGYGSSYAVPTALRLASTITRAIAKKDRENEPNTRPNTLSEKVLDETIVNIGSLTGLTVCCVAVYRHAQHIADSAQNHNWGMESILPLAINAISLSYEWYRTRKK